MNQFLQQTESSLIRKMNNMSGPDTINLGMGQVDLEPLGMIDVECKQALDRGRGWHKYTPTMGVAALRQDIADYHDQRERTQYSADNVLVTAGATQAITSAFLGLLGKDKDNVLVPEISYPTYSIIPQMIGQGAYAVETFRLDKNLQPDMEDLENKVTGSTILVLNSPSNPTGSVISEENIRAIADLVEGQGALVLSDEVYSEFYYNQRPTSMSRFLPEQTVVCDSLSKSGLIPGMRVGWAIAPDEILENITKAHQFSSSCVNSIAQEAAKTALRQTSSLHNLRGYLETNRNLLNAFLKNEGLESHSEAGIYAFVDISKYGDSMSVAENLLKERDVLTIPGKAFGPSGDKYLRISFGATHEDLVEGVYRIQGHFKDAK